MAEPRLIEGNLSSDTRGEVGFVNDFRFEGVKRFYTVTNHAKGFVRAWHGHKKEAKYVTVIQGAALIAAVKVNNWQAPSKDSKIYSYAVSSRKPAVVHIPGGYVNGFMSLTQDAKVMFFSTATLEESLKDDIRYDARYWNPWDSV